VNDSLWFRNAWCQFITVLPLVIYRCPSNLFHSFTASSQQSRHFQAFISTSANRKERLIYFDFICMLNISVAKQSSLVLKSSTTSFQPCAPADGCFSRSILSSTQSQGSITSLSFQLPPHSLFQRIEHAPQVTPSMTRWLFILLLGWV
jgi:hypothetical protein